MRYKSSHGNKKRILSEMRNLIHFFLLTIHHNPIEASYKSSPPLKTFHFSEAEEDINSTQNAS